MMAQRTNFPPCLLALAMAALPLTASAQSSTGAGTIAGSIASIDDAGNMELNDNRGYIDSVRLGGETVVRPSGTRLVIGMVVSIAGVNRGSFFAANEVDVDQQSLPPQGGDMPMAAPQGPVPQGPPPQAHAPLPDRSALPPLLARSGDLMGNLDTPLDSAHSAVGDEVVLSDVSSADGSIRHARLSGAVSNVVRPGQGHTAQIEIRFDRLQLRDGTAYRIDGVVTSMQVATKNNTLKEVGGALAGMLAGNAIGKTVFGIGGGGLVGAVGGFLIAKDNRADVVVPDQTAIGVRILRARRQAS
jgi:hypothetical protein